MSEFEGIITPMLTPFNKKGEVSKSKLKKLSTFLVDQGIDGLFPIASTGEMSSLSLEEKKEIIETVANEVGDDVPVIPGTGSSSIEETLELSHFVEDTGGDAIIVVTPYYLQPDQKGLQTYFSKVASSVDLPLIMYQIPSLTGVHLDSETVTTLAKQNDTIIGLKDSSGDFVRLLEIKRKTSEDFQIFQGLDTLLLPSLLFGCSGGINGTTNVEPKFALQVFKHYKKGNIEKARDMQLNKLTPLANACSKGVFPAGFKAAARTIGRNWGYPRAPIRSLEPREESEIEEILNNVGLL